MEENNKDELYYYDLIYEIKNICGLIHYGETEQDTEMRIYNRKNEMRTVDTKGSGPMKTDFRTSEFNSDVVKCIRRISDISNQSPASMKTVKDINKLHYTTMIGRSGYADAIDIVLQELEEKKLSVTKKEGTGQKR